MHWWPLRRFWIRIFPMNPTAQWPWRRGPCEYVCTYTGLCPNSATLTARVRPCFQCRRNYCEEHDIDACSCGELCCHPCRKSHLCRGSSKPPRAKLSQGIHEIHPWLRKITDNLACINPRCYGMRDIGTLACEICEKSRCVVTHCTAELKTRRCCGIDTCDNCFIPEDNDPDFGVCLRCAAPFDEIHYPKLLRLMDECVARNQSNLEWAGRFGIGDAPSGGKRGRKQ